MFSYICWAAPMNVPVNQLFGVGSGMGMSFFIGSPLMGKFLVSHSMDISDICQPNQVLQLTCPHNQVFYTASAVW